MSQPYGTEGKSQANARTSKIGASLLSYDEQTDAAINRLALTRSQLNDAYLLLPTLGLTPTELAELQQEYIDVDTKIVTDTQAYATPLVPIS